MTREQERWAEALAIERMYGEDAPRWIAERIAALARVGEVDGVERFRMIANLLDQLRRTVLPS